MSVRALSILSILAMLFFVALLVLQGAEYGYYRAEPSVWATSP